MVCALLPTIKKLSVNHKRGAGAVVELQRKYREGQLAVITNFSYSEKKIIHTQSKMMGKLFFSIVFL
jgi:hypothetical protein